MALHRAFTGQRPCQQSLSARPTAVSCVGVQHRLCRIRVGQQQRVQSADTSTPEACAMQILAFWQDRNLEGLLPFMSEISVVKAVVR
jgi:hypothetical protein